MKLCNFIQKCKEAENEKGYLSPHTAAFTDECMLRMGKETIQNIIDFFEEKLEKSKIVKL